LAITLSSSDFEPRLTVAAGDNAPLADATRTFDGGPVVMLTAAGSRQVTVRSMDADALGDYSLTIDDAAGAISGCLAVYAERGVTTSQQIETTDCATMTPYYDPVYFDRIYIYLEAGETFTIAMTAEGFTPYSTLYRPDGLRQDCEGDLATGCTYAAFSSGYFALWVGSATEYLVGDYTLSID
jgi:hypothetical protein